MATLPGDLDLSEPLDDDLKQFDFRSSESDEAKLSVLREETFTVCKRRTH